MVKKGARGRKRGVLPCAGVDQHTGHDLTIPARGGHCGLSEGCFCAYRVLVCCQFPAMLYTLNSGRHPRAAMLG